MSIADIVIIAIVLISVILGIIKGFIKSFVGMISLVVAIFIASLVATPISGWIYDSYLQKPISEAIGIRVVSPMGFRTGLVTANRFVMPLPATVADLKALTNVEGILKELDPAYVESLDPAETQKFVNFLCSPTCSGKTLSSCTSAYNKKYGTNINITPILKSYGVSASTKVPALVSITGMKIEVKDAIVKVQKDNAAKAAAASAAAASKAASSAASKSKVTSSVTSKVTSSVTSKVTSSAASRVTSSATSRVTSSKVTSSKASSSKTTSSKAVSSRVTSPASSAVVSSLALSSVAEVSTVLSQPQDSEQAAVNPISDTVRGIAVKIISCVVFILVSIIIRLLLGLVARVLDKIVQKIPIIRGINHILGAVVGLVNGALISLLAVVAFTFLSPLITDSPVYTKAVEDSYICTKVRDAIYSDTDTTAGLFPEKETSGEDFPEEDFDFSEEDFDFSE